MKGEKIKKKNKKNNWLNKIIKGKSEGFTKKFVRKMFNDTPMRKITGCTFGNEHMNMRIPLKATPKSVKNANKPGSKILGFVKFIKHKEDSICSSFKKKI